MKTTHTLYALLSLAITLSACKPKPKEEVLGRPPASDYRAPVSKTPRLALSEMDAKKNRAWLKKCYETTSLDRFEINLSGREDTILLSATNHPDRGFRARGVPDALVDQDALTRCLEAALDADPPLMPRDLAWTTAHAITISATDDRRENIRVSHYNPVTGGPVSSARRDEQIARVYPDIQRCHARVLRDIPDAEGALLASFQLDKYGAPEELEILNTIRAPGFTPCLQSVLSKMRFPPLEGDVLIRELLILTPR